FFNHPSSTPLYTPSLHDALPISLQPTPYPPYQRRQLTLEHGFSSLTLSFHSLFCTTCSDQRRPSMGNQSDSAISRREFARRAALDRKSTRLNSSHVAISYAVFCL